MTELLDLDQLQKVACIAEPPELGHRRPTPTLRWTIDATSGRPVSCWVIEDALVTRTLASD
jgi:hypothetical protein